MAGKIFINYRRDDSIGMAGRLHDRLAQTFGRDNLFMDVDHIPVGEDFVAYLNSQVAACDVVLVIIGPNWLRAKGKAGQRRLHQPDDFVAIEISAALARNIRVIPVLVDGARMPKESELPDSLKPLARRQSAEVRHAHFGHDAEALIARMRKALGDEAAGLGRWRLRAAIGVAAIAVLLLIGWGGYAIVRHAAEQRAQQAELKREEERKSAEAEANRKADEAERQRKQGQAAADIGDLNRAIANFSEAIRLDPKNAIAFFNRGVAYAKKDDFDRAITDYNEAIQLDPKNPRAFFSRGFAYAKKGDLDRAIADYSEVIRLDPKNAIAFANRGSDHFKKGDFDRAITDANDAIRLNPNIFAWVYCIRGNAKLKINDTSGNADIAKARQLDDSSCR
jgi:tetratricopeptide (TPR) repeat protein